MKVLSIRQPYSSLLVLGTKRFEARTWKTDYRGPLLIHASSATVTSTTIQDLECDRDTLRAIQNLGWTTEGAVKSLPRSSIIGEVTLSDIIPSDVCEGASKLDYRLAAEPSPDVYFWVARDGKAISPIPVGGKLNLWNLSAELEIAVKQALSSNTASWATHPANSGRELRVIEFRAIEDLVPIVGTDAMTVGETFSAALSYADRNDLLSSQQVRLNSALQFLAPGRKRLTRQEFLLAIGDHLERC